MPIRWDTLLVHHLAHELDERFRGARLRGLRLDGDARDLLLLFRDVTLLWRLHPTRGWLSLHPAQPPGDADIRLASRVRAVVSTPDERVVRFQLAPERGGGRPLDLVVELIGNQWNACAVGADGIVRHALMTRGGPRPCRVGHAYFAPPPTLRAGAGNPVPEALWTEVLNANDPLRDLMTRLAWTSTINAPTLLSPGRPAGDARALWERWTDLDAPSTPVVLDTPRGPQPYPFPLPGVPSSPAPDLLAAFLRAEQEASASGGASAGASAAALLEPELVRRLERALVLATRKLSRLQAEYADLPAPAALRAVGDLLLARYGEVPSGAASVTLVDFDGADRTIELDPRAAPHENASRYYDRAGRAERASERLPSLIASAGLEHDRIEALVEAANAGSVDPDAIRREVPEPAPRRGGRAEGPSLPYTTFVSSGGLEIRVGRGAKHNDDLTFRHSAPGDVWLHARHSAGAHVVLRWPGPGNPPARDLEEAAVLAALNSKARTSGSAPVDWTFRKYVRKPRGAAPGKVVAERAQTVFVTPDSKVAESLERKRDQDG